MKRRVRRFAAALAVVGLIVAACTSGGSAAPSPTATFSPSPSPSASPSPTPDVAALFVAKMKALTAASMVVTGELHIGAVSAVMSGRVDVAGADSYSTVTATIGTVKTTTEETTWSGRSYTRTSNGPWYEKKASSGGVGDVTGTIASAAERGVVTKNGRQLHRLGVIGPSVEPTAFGFDGAGTVGLEFFAEADGTPAIMEVTFEGTQSAPAASKMSGRFDFTFTPGASPTISRPEPIFTTFVSKKGYSLGYPSDWDTGIDGGYELFEGPNAELVTVEVEANGSRTVANMASGIVLELKKAKATIVSNEAGRLGGEESRIIYFTFSQGDVDWNGMFVLAAHAGSSFWLTWKSATGTESTDKATFGYLIDSFKFTK